MWTAEIRCVDGSMQLAEAADLTKLDQLCEGLNVVGVYHDMGDYYNSFREAYADGHR